MTLGLVTSKSPTQGHALANLAGAEREHEIVHGAKMLEATVVSAVLLKCLMKRPVSLERLASLVSVCFFIAKTVVASSAQLQVYVIHVLPCVLCALRVGTPCICSEPPVNISTAEFSPGDFIFVCNVLTIATLLPETHAAVAHTETKMPLSTSRTWSGSRTSPVHG